MPAPLTEAEQAETEAFVARYLALREAAATIDNLSHLRASHAELLVAAKEAVLAHGRNDIPGFYASIAHLRAAIANAEKEVS